VKGSGSGLFLDYFMTFQNLPRATKEKYKKLSRVNWPLWTNINPGPNKYEAGVLTTQL
jgi:hypothetical protein